MTGNLNPILGSPLGHRGGKSSSEIRRKSWKCNHRWKVESRWSHVQCIGSYRPGMCLCSLCNLQISFFTDGSEEIYKKTEKEQFFHNDYLPLVYDLQNNFVDESTQLPPHMIDPYPRCDSLGKPYIKQVAMETHRFK